MTMFLMLRYLWLVLMLGASVGPVWAQTAAAECTPQFCQVDEKLARGEQPLLPDTIKELQRRGIKTIINLRGRDQRTLEEERLAQAAGITYYSLPLAGLRAPSDEQVHEILDVIQRAEGPVFVHCRHGQDRTGVIVACYRIEHGWTNKAAYKEVKRRHLSRLQFGMRHYIKHYRAR